MGAAQEHRRTTHRQLILTVLNDPAHPSLSLTELREQVNTTLRAGYDTLAAVTKDLC